MTQKECTSCHRLLVEGKDFSFQYTRKRTGVKKYRATCRDCFNSRHNLYRNTEQGCLKDLYYNLGTRNKCYFTWEEFVEAFAKHKSVYGMKSAWGPGPPHLDKHVEMTISAEGAGVRGHRGSVKGSKRKPSNISVDRIDSKLGYTLQNIIFITSGENRRKNDSSYEDSLIHVKIYEDRFIKMKAI